MRLALRATVLLVVGATYFLGWGQLTIHGSGMLPTLPWGQSLLLERATLVRLLDHEVDRGDVVSFAWKDRTRVARVVGIAGDRVAVVDDRVSLNGTLLTNDVTDERTGPGWDRRCAQDPLLVHRETIPRRQGTAQYGVTAPATDGEALSLEAVVVPDGHVLTLPDRRPSLRDNDEETAEERFVPVPLSALRGIVLRRLWRMDDCSGLRTFARAGTRLRTVTP
ncbi:MAG: signal peptidase I [Myxococcota bacterium]